LRAEDLSDWLQQQPAGPWNDLLLEAVENYGIETSNETLPSTAFREWLAEWARDNRRRQHGLLLTSAHRAKGLEFEHVVILDGNWQNVTGGEDSDAPRRLYYVTMTRAKRTLTLAKVGNSNPFLRDLRGHTSVQVRPEQDNVPPAPPEMKRKYLRLSLRDVNLSFAGRKRPEDPVHQAIKRLSPGDPLRVKTDKNPWELTATDGTTVGRLAQSFDVPEGVNEASAIKLAIATWDKERSEGQCQHLLKCDRWEVVIPEIVLP
jgi:ATP-dependent DNA helicase RecQ